MSRQRAPSTDSDIEICPPETPYRSPIPPPHPPIHQPQASEPDATQTRPVTHHLPACTDARTIEVDLGHPADAVTPARIQRLLAILEDNPLPSLIQAIQAQIAHLLDDGIANPQHDRVPDPPATPHKPKRPRSSTPPRPSSSKRKYESRLPRAEPGEQDLDPDIPSDVADGLILEFFQTHIKVMCPASYRTDDGVIRCPGGKGISMAHGGLNPGHLFLGCSSWKWEHDRHLTHYAQDFPPGFPIRRFAESLLPWVANQSPTPAKVITRSARVRLQ